MPRLQSFARRQPETRRLRSGRPRKPTTIAQRVNVTNEVSQITWASRTFHLRRPIDLSRRRKGPYHFIGLQPSLGIEGYGRSEQEVLESFADVFAATWDWIVATDSRLTEKPGN